MRLNRKIQNCCFEIRDEIGYTKQPDKLVNEVIMKACKKHELGFDHIKTILGL